MSIDLRRFTELKSQVESLQKKADRSQGALDQLKVQLKKEFGVDTLEEAEKLSTKLDREEKECEREYLQALARFEKQWKDKLCE